MSAAVLYFSVLATAAVWWLVRHGIASRPWLDTGAGEVAADEPSPARLARTGLGVLLAAISSLFALSISAYLLRMQLADWRPTPKPTLLWINTGVLMLSSAALAWARAAADHEGDIARVRGRLLAASMAALIFVAGQIVAWGDLSTSGYGVSANPASSFFFLLTGLHAAHVLGGVLALGRTTARAWSGEDPERLRLGLALCNTYWDFLLVVWLILFGLLLLS